jgi:hypothetical protein
MYGQQTFVTRYDAYVGYAFLDSPHVSLSENGVAFQIGFRPKTWYSVGFDYSYSSGDLTLTPNLLLPSLQQQLTPLVTQILTGNVLAGKISPTAAAAYSLVVPAHSKTQTFAVGPQLAYRHWEHATLFLRPVFAGAIHENATPMVPTDPVGSLVVPGVLQGFQALNLIPASGHKTDTTWFLGFGGGFDILFSKHVGLRTQADLVYDHLFSDLLKDGRFTVRFSIGPCFNFGKNIAGGASAK